MRSKDKKVCTCGGGPWPGMALHAMNCPMHDEAVFTQAYSIGVEGGKKQVREQLAGLAEKAGRAIHSPPTEKKKIKRLDLWGETTFYESELRSKLPDGMMVVQQQWRVIEEKINEIIDWINSQ